ncbi:MAG TPA: 2'-5' RNA ligase family protein [Candidatus Caenarcaniphilales bacterium]
MTRYFIGLLPPQEIQDAANRIKQQFADCYGSRKAQSSPPHITLQPPFEWPAPQVAVLEQCLETFARCYKPVAVQLSGFGAFAPRVIYIKVETTLALQTLHRELAAHLESKLHIISSASKNRTFTPHLTVAFRDLTRENFQAAWARFQHQPFEFNFTVPALTLLIHNERHWTIGANFSLG